MTKHKLLIALLFIVAAGQINAQSRLDVPMTLEEKLATVQSVPFLKKISDLAFKKGDWPRYIAALRRTAELRPYSQPVLFQLAAAYSLDGQRSRAYDLLLQLQQEGLTADLESEPAFDNIRGHEVYDYIVFLFEENAKPFGNGEVVAQINDAEKVIEAMTFDPARNAILAGSVADGSISIVQDDGSLEPLITADEQNKLAGVMGMGIDAERDLLWVSSATVPANQHAAADGTIVNYLHKFRLSTGQWLANLPSPVTEQPQLFTALVVAPNGDVFVADRLSPAIYRTLEGEDSLIPYVGIPGKEGFRGMAMSDDGHFIYVADQTFGLFAIDLEKERVVEMKKDKLNLGGIEGVAITGNELIVVQNGIRPNRVLKLMLADDGFTIEGEQPLEASHPAFEFPTSGYVSGRNYVYIANSQRARFDATGSPVIPLDPVLILSSSLDFESQEPPRLFDPEKAKSRRPSGNNAPSEASEDGGR